MSNVVRTKWARYARAKVSAYLIKYLRDIVLGSLVQVCGSLVADAVFSKLVTEVDGIFHNILYDDMINAESKGDMNE